MATGYQGYGAGYGDPERAKLDRSRRLAEMLQEGALDTGPKSLWEGVAQLGKAFIARDAMGRADQAESAYGDTVKTRNARLAAALMPDAQGVANDQLNSASPFDLTPSGAEGRQDRGAANVGQRAILEALMNEGGLAAGVGYAQGQEQRQYARDRDATEDRRWDAQFDFTKDRAATQDSQWNRSFDQSANQFDQTMDLNRDQFDFTKGRAVVEDNQWGQTFNETKRQFDARMAAEKAEAEAKASGNAVFDGPQLATIYNKGMDAIGAAKEAQGNLDIIANTAQQFLDVAGNDTWLQGAGFGNDLMQAGSMKTSDLKALSDRIAPLMRMPGSGASSDKDVEMFQRSVVNINNTPAANQRFAEGARAMQQRNQEYIDFLTQAINPQDPQSRQKAEQLWNIYKRDQQLFGEDGAVNAGALPFNDWLAENMGAITSTPNGIATGIQRAPVGTVPDDIDSLLEKYR